MRLILLLSIFMYKYNTAKIKRKIINCNTYTTYIRFVYITPLHCCCEQEIHFTLRAMRIIFVRCSSSDKLIYFETHS